MRPSATSCRAACVAASAGVARVAAASRAAARSFTLRIVVLHGLGKEAGVASSRDVRLLRHRPKETLLHALSTRREACADRIGRLGWSENAGGSNYSGLQ